MPGIYRRRRGRPRLPRFEVGFLALVKLGDVAPPVAAGKGKLTRARTSPIISPNR
jgi:hypothetical protein